MWTSTLKRAALVAAALVIGTSGPAAADDSASASFARLTVDLFAPAVAGPADRVAAGPKVEPTNPATMDSLFDLGPRIVSGVDPASVWVDGDTSSVVSVVTDEMTEPTEPVEPGVPAMPVMPAEGSAVAAGLPSVASAVSASQRLPVAPTLDITSMPGMPRAELRRPPTMLPLYVTFAALQMLDGHSTTKALKGGAVEANAIMAPFAGNAGALYATKIATTAATIYLGEKLWRKNRLAAVATLLVVNSAYAAIVSHNYSVANR